MNGARAAFTDVDHPVGHGRGRIGDRVAERRAPRDAETAVGLDGQADDAAAMPLMPAPTSVTNSIRPAAQYAGTPPRPPLPSQSFA